MEKYLLLLFDLKKIPGKLISLLSLVSGFILFGPEKVTSQLQLHSVIIQYGMYLGLSFLLSTGIFLIAIYDYSFTEIKIWRQSGKREKSIISKLKTLTFEEKAVLREFNIQEKSVLRMPILDEIVLGLVNSGVIYKSTEFGANYFGILYCNFSLSKTATAIISKDLLDLPEKPTKKEISFISENRPKWLGVIFESDKITMGSFY